MEDVEERKAKTMAMMLFLADPALFQRKKATVTPYTGSPMSLVSMVGVGPNLCVYHLEIAGVTSCDRTARSWVATRG